MQANPIILTAGEPAGIGPDLCILLHDWLLKNNVTICADIELLRNRAKHQQKKCYFHYADNPSENKHSLAVIHTPCLAPVKIGQLNPKNAAYVLNTLDIATQKVIDQEFSAIVTAPVHKGIICEAGFAFSGHTEFLEKKTNAKKTVMCLATDNLKVSLLTTHLPLSEVPKTISEKLLTEIIEIIDHDLQKYFCKNRPKIAICGLNPHAGEMGFLGQEEITIINPTLEALSKKGYQVNRKALPADTIFNKENIEYYDTILAMYHDQGLPVIKAMGFGQCVNITLGLPIIRTSVDHGTALSLAGTQDINTGSLKKAVVMATNMVKANEK